ncbi:MAG: hypothetical protein QHH20_01190 [Candidatus Bathyarchaeota archaeon]|nr:hypothetical protein [Candidatus Bathyarchaeota archaeon]
MFVYWFVSRVFANPIPIGPPPISGTPMEYFIIFIAEAFGLLGVGMLTRNNQTRWEKAAITMAVALVASYVVGITIWTSGYMAGISLYNPLVIPPRGTPNLAGLVIVLLPEFIGTIIGGIIIHAKQRTYWSTAFGTMALAMLTSLLAGSMLVTVFLS